MQQQSLWKAEHDCDNSPCKLRFTLNEQSKHHHTPNLGRSPERLSGPLSKDVILAARNVLADGGVPNQHQHHSPTTACAPLRCLAVHNHTGLVHRVRLLRLHTLCPSIFMQVIVRAVPLTHSSVAAAIARWRGKPPFCSTQDLFQLSTCHPQI